MSLDFGLGRFNSGLHVFIRYRPDTPGFLLVQQNRVQLAVVDRLLLHIDFPAAEYDGENDHSGVLARGTGVLQFNHNRPPHIVSRDLSRAILPQNVGFVLDCASPYPIPGVIDGIGRHIIASSFPGAKEAFHDAYRQYCELADRMPESSLGDGIPVFDVYGWSTSRLSPDGNDTRMVNKPRFNLVGFVPTITTPLPQETVAQANAVRASRMQENNWTRPRLGVKELA